MSEKLVRDKMPELCQKNPGWTPMTYRVVSGPEKLKFLLQKLVEESTEARESSNLKDLESELADVLEVIRAVQAHCKIYDNTLETVREDKFVERGGLYNGIVWDGNK